MTAPLVVSVVQARMGSSRLPGKVLLPLGGATVLERMLDRVARATLGGTRVVATTTAPADDDIEALCGRAGVACNRAIRRTCSIATTRWRGCSAPPPS